MANEGNVIVQKARPYENLQSLKKYVKYGANQGYYLPNTVKEFNVQHNKLTTGATAIEFEALGDVALAIGQIGRTEIAVSLGAPVDQATHNTVIFTLIYNDADGVSHTAVATGTATLATTQVAFVPPITDFYAATSFTASTTFTTQDVIVETSASTAVWATITATATAATEAQLLGVGAIYGRTSTNHDDGDGVHLYLEYLSGTGLVKHGHCTINTTDGTTEVRFFEAADDGDGTTTATLITVKDFYRIRWCHTNKTPTSNTGEFLITDAACANVDGSGGDIYGIMVEGDYEMTNTRYCTPTGYDAWLGHWHVMAAQVAVGAATDTYDFVRTFYARGWSQLRTESHRFGQEMTDSNPILLEELKDYTFGILDNATAQTVTLTYIILEAKRV